MVDSLKKRYIAMERAFCRFCMCLSKEKLYKASMAINPLILF